MARARSTMTRQSRQNLLFILLLTLLGVFLSILQTMADRMAVALNWQPSDAGMLISIYAMGSMISVALSSTLADWAGKRRVMAVTLGFLSLGLSLVFLAHSLVPLALGLFLFGFGYGPTEGLANAVLSDENPLQAAKYVNIAHAGFSIGAIVAPPLAVMAVQQSGSYHLNFLLAAFLALIFLLWVALTAKNPPLKKPAHSLSPFKMLELLHDRRFISVLLMMFFYMGYESVASSYTKQLFLRGGSTEAVSALMISLFWGTMILGRLVGAALAGREVLSIRAYALVAAAGMLTLVLAGSFTLRVVGVVLYGFGCGPTWPMLAVLAARLFPQRSGSAMGMLMLSTMAGLTLFPSLIGTLPDNLTVTFLCAAALAVGVFLLTLQKHVKQSAGAGTAG